MKIVRDLIGTTDARRSERSGKMSLEAEAEAAPSRSPISRRCRRRASSSSSSFRSFRFLLTGEAITIRPFRGADGSVHVPRPVHVRGGIHVPRPVHVPRRDDGLRRGTVVVVVVVGPHGGAEQTHDRDRGADNPFLHVAHLPVRPRPDHDGSATPGHSAGIHIDTSGSPVNTRFQVSVRTHTRASAAGEGGGAVGTLRRWQVRRRLGGRVVPGRVRAWRSGGWSRTTGIGCATSGCGRWPMRRTRSGPPWTANATAPRRSGASGPTGADTGGAPASRPSATTAGSWASSRGSRTTRRANRGACTSWR